MTFVAYVMWGIIPIYWKQLTMIGTLDLLTIRIIVSAITLIIVVFIGKKVVFTTYLKDPKIRIKLIVSACLISINWGVFVYAINAGFVLQASLGYYINPLVTVFLGIFIMKERLSKSQYISIILALIGVIYLAIAYGEFPWISIVLAFSFGFYGLVKKLYQLDSINSLLVETLYSMPVMLIIMLFFGTDHSWIQQIGANEIIFILLAGIITSVPLLLFSEGAKRIPLSAVGFLQYIAPTLMLLVGVILYNENFTSAHVISFSFIWLGLVIYTVSVFKKK